MSPYKEWYSSLAIGLSVKDLPQPMEALQDLHSAIAHHIWMALSQISAECRRKVVCGIARWMMSHPSLLAGF